MAPDHKESKSASLVSSRLGPRSFAALGFAISRTLLSPDFKLFRSNSPAPSSHLSLFLGYQVFYCPVAETLDCCF